MEQLRPCPFCGGEAVLENTLSGAAYKGKFSQIYRVGCKACKFYLRRDSDFYIENGEVVFIKNGYKDAIKAWNTRSYDKYDFSIDKYGITFKSEIVKEGIEET